MAGDFQAKQAKKVERKLESATSAEAIIKVIEEIETDYQLQCEETHDTLKDSAFKRIRRIMPVI